MTHLQERSARLDKEDSPRACHAHRASRAVEELHIQLTFHLPNLPAQGRLGHIESRGSPGEMQLFRDGDEIRQLP